MKIEDNNKLHEQTLKSENEIENIKRIYANKIEAAKTEGEDRYIKTLNRNDGQLIEANKNYEEKLVDLQDNLKHTEKTLANEEKELKNNQTYKLDNLKDQFRDNFEKQNEIVTDTLRSAHENAKLANQRIVNSARAEKDYLTMTSKGAVNSLANEYNQKQMENQRDYKINLDNELQSHHTELNHKKDELKNVLDKTTSENKKLEATKKQVQNLELSTLENRQKAALSQKQSDFKVRYENLVKEHESVLNQLKEHFESDKNKMTLENSIQKRTIANKMEDNFYRIESLNPKIVDNEKEYIVSLNVPEHEQENVHLIVHGRGVKMTLTRKFVDSVEASDGSTNKSSRSELFSKDFASKDLLDHKQIVQKYENGTLSFKVPKL